MASLLASGLPSIGFVAIDNFPNGGLYHNNRIFSLKARKTLPGTFRTRPRQCTAELSSNQDGMSVGRRAALGAVTAGVCVAGVVGLPEPSDAVSRRALRELKIPESDFKEGPDGLKYYDITVGKGQRADKGDRVAIHYVAKWKGITFMTSRQGMGVTGGTPYGFDIGSSSTGIVLKGLDLGVEGMRVGGERLLLVPPNLAYGNRGVQEIPPGATLEFNVELLSIKQDVYGSRVKIVEG